MALQGLGHTSSVAISGLDLPSRVSGPLLGRIRSHSGSASHRYQPPSITDALFVIHFLFSLRNRLGHSRNEDDPTRGRPQGISHLPDAHRQIDRIDGNAGQWNALRQRGYHPILIPIAFQ